MIDSRISHFINEVRERVKGMTREEFFSSVPPVERPAFNGMTVKEIRSYRSTEEGAKRWCEEHNYEPRKCLKEISIVANSEMEEAKQKWEEALSTTGKETMENLLEAEILMGSWGYYPPHFVYEAKCLACGPTLTPYPELKEIDECIFCKSGYTEVTNQMLKDIRDERIEGLFG